MWRIHRGREASPPGWLALAAVCALGCPQSAPGPLAAEDAGSALDAKGANDVVVDLGDPNGQDASTLADQSADAPDTDALDAAIAPDIRAEAPNESGPRPDASMDADTADVPMPCNSDAGTGPGEDLWAPDTGSSPDTGTSPDGGSGESGATSAHALYCTADMPCPRPLICAGIGCDDNWQCFSHFAPHHPCPTDLAPYCGCDGVTFYAIRSCPDRPYDRAGRCEDGVNCDPTAVRCSGPELGCPEGQVPQVENGQYTRCVPVGLCQCEFVFECPHREKYACDPTSKRCQPLPRDP